MQVFEGKVGSLRRFKEDVREVASGLECGIGLENFNDVKAGDVIEAFEVEEVARRLTPDASMVVGVLRLVVYIPENHSLKGKRGVLRKIKAQVSNNFNVSISECDDQDLWQRATLGLSQVGTEEGQVDGALRAVVKFIDGLGLVEVAEEKLEFLHYSSGL